MKDFGWIEPIILAIGGLITGAGGMFAAGKSQKKDKYDVLFDSMNNELKETKASEKALSVQLEQHRQQISDLRDEIADLRSKSVIHGAINMNSRYPRWKTHRDGTMWEFNEAYADKYIRPFGKNANEYVGKTPSEFWGEAMGEKYGSIDRHVLATGRTFIGFIPVSDTHGSEIEFLFRIEPIYLGKTIIGIVGEEIASKEEIIKLVEESH